MPEEERFEPDAMEIIARQARTRETITQLAAVSRQAEEIEKRERARQEYLIKFADTHNLPDVLKMRVATAENVEEAQRWQEMYRKVIRDQNLERDHSHRRSIASLSEIMTWVASFGAVALGTWLMVNVSFLPGFFIAGGGLSKLAPGYVKEFVREYFGRGSHRSEEGAEETESPSEGDEGTPDEAEPEGE